MIQVQTTIQILRKMEKKMCKLQCVEVHTLLKKITVGLCHFSVPD